MIKRGQMDQLIAFAAVADHGSFTKAAAALGLTTSTLSHTLKVLEQQLGVSLLRRNSRSVSVTVQGEQLLRALSPAFADIKTALSDLSHISGHVSGALRLTATHEGYEAIVRPVLKEFCERHPDASIEVLIDYGLRDIVAERFDAGIRLGEKLSPDTVAFGVGGDLRMAVVASPAYVRIHDVPLQPRDLQRHRCINYRLQAAGALYRWEFERAGECVDVAVEGPLTFNEPSLMLEAALDGLGVAYLLESSVSDLVADGRLTRFLEDWTPPFGGYAIYYPSRRQVSPALSAFLSLLRSRHQVVPDL
jgi:DNA-binding transcriptional LysR family regulator